jgi:diguanylate cyclase (GGDEF)-like protein/putative nucleotidyltransferase with HDIG domain
MNDTIPTRVKIGVVVTAAIGTAVLGTALEHWQSKNLLQFGLYLLIAILASTMKMRLPGMESTMSVHFLFVLFAIVDLDLSEALVIGCSAALVQSLWKTTRKPELLKVTFNVLSMTANAIWLTYFVFHLSLSIVNNRLPLMLLLATCTYFLSNTVPVSLVIAQCGKVSLRKIWMETYFWSFPYYLVGGSLVGFFSYLVSVSSWPIALMTLPIIYGIYKSYQMYLGRLMDQKKRIEIEELQVEAEKRHVEEICALHMRTIEALALAIDAKDHSTYSHLTRVRTFALEIAQEFGLSAAEMDALRAAALLHDIGKLAVPDHIINKPGRLTPEEFEKMKIHPLVGAEILERVAFPYPVAPIVRAHHEKWNGRGYPDGLKGEEIPIGARILSAADCLDALASDRQYRRALSLDEAMNVVSAESGTSFDPKVIETLQRRYIELERQVLDSSAGSEIEKIDYNRTIIRGKEPETGLEGSPKTLIGGPADFLYSIASARHEAYTLFELTQELGSSLSLDESLSLVSIKLRKLVPYDSIVAFIRQGDVLVPEYVSGENFRLLSSLVIPLSTGLCGWVAENSRSIINGNPDADFGALLNSRLTTKLRSSLAVPLVGITGVVGVLALYQCEENAFSNDNLRVLQVITSKVALFIENALKYRQAENSAAVDYLTGLPNARSLSLELERELGRAKREHSTTVVMVCDLNGFKQVNDRFGHLKGDEVLKLFAGLMQEKFRPYDFLARMGGDEFVLVAPNLTIDAVREKAIVLDALARQAGCRVCSEDVLSLSVGAACYPQDGEDAAQLLAEADRRMYADKQVKLLHRTVTLPRLMSHFHPSFMN